jgi:hypothetical protein
VLIALRMLNKLILANMPLTVGLVCLASLATGAQVHARPAPGGPGESGPAQARLAIPQQNGSITGFEGTTFGDSQPYHLRGTVVYDIAGGNAVIREVHVFGWSETNGHYPYRCGKFVINAKRAWVNGGDISRNLGFEASLQPQGWVSSSWVARFSGNQMVIPRGKPVLIRADAAYDGGNCIIGGKFSITSSVTVR